MTEAEWKEVDIAFEELCVVYLPKEYLFEFRKFTRIVDRFIQDNKPFEVEVGKEYVAKFDAMCVYLCEVSCIKKGEIITVSSVNDNLIWFSNTNGYFYADQFKACFKPLENDKN